MKARRVGIYGLSLLLVGCIAYANYGGGKKPGYVQEAVAAVSNKMSYSFGISTCEANQMNGAEWNMVCHSATKSPALTSSIQSADHAPYDVPTSFYLTATNDPAKKAAEEDLLKLLMINGGSKIKSDG